MVQVCVGGRAQEGSRGECVSPVLRALVGRMGEPDTEPTTGDTGQGITASKSRRHTAWTPHDCQGTGAGGA